MTYPALDALLRARAALDKAHADYLDSLKPGAEDSRSYFAAMLTQARRDVRDEERRLCRFGLHHEVI